MEELLAQHSRESEPGPENATPQRLPPELLERPLIARGLPSVTCYQSLAESRGSALPEQPRRVAPYVTRYRLLNA